MKFPSLSGLGGLPKPSWQLLKRWAMLLFSLPLLLWRWIKQKYEKRRRATNSLLGRRSFFPPQIIFVPLMFVPLFLGAVIGLDAPVLVAILSAMVGAVMVFAMLNTNGMLLAMFVLTFLVQGSALYFGHVRQAPWIAVGMAGLFFMRALLELTTQNRVVAKDKKSSAAGNMMIALSIYLSCYVASFLINRPPASQMIASIKSMMPMFGVLMALYWFHWGTVKMERLWKLALLITMLQFPVVAYQHFVVAARRAQGFDSVVGTFGGTEGHGGLSAVMIVFVIVTLGYALARWNRGLADKKTTLIFVLTVIAIILLGEVKASFLWLPLVCLIVLRKRVLKNVFTLITYGAVTTCLLLLIYVVYNALYWSNLKGNEGSMSEKFNRTGGYFFDTSNVDYKTGEVSRGASLGLWANDRVSSLPKRLIGYGPGSSKTGGSLGKGEVARRFEPLSIDSTTLAVMLWDVGILGTLGYVALMMAGLWNGIRFLWSGRGSEHQKAMIEACLAAYVMLFSLLIYNRGLTDEPTLQLLYLFLLGTITQVVRYPDPDTVVVAAPKIDLKKLPRGQRLQHKQWPRRRPPVVYPRKIVREH